MTNTTLSTASTTGLNKSFYDRQLLESAKTRFIHAKFGQKRSIPKNNGKHVEFRRWNLFNPNVEANALEEGVTPQGQSLSQSSVEARGETIRRLCRGKRPSRYDGLRPGDIGYNRAFGRTAGHGCGMGDPRRYLRPATTYSTPTARPPEYSLKQATSSLWMR